MEAFYNYTGLKGLAALIGVDLLNLSPIQCMFLDSKILHGIQIELSFPFTSILLLSYQLQMFKMTKRAQRNGGTRVEICQQIQLE